MVVDRHVVVVLAAAIPIALQLVSRIAIHHVLVWDINNRKSIGETESPM